MAFTTLGLNKMLNGITYAFASLHTGFPGQTGANEVTGSSYARQAITVSAASGEQRSLSAAVSFSVPACTVAWIGFRDSIGDPVAYSPNGGAPIEFEVDLANNLILADGHALTNTQKVVVYKGTVPSPLVEATIYFVVNATTNTLQLAATSGGTPIVLTGAGTTAALLSPIVEDVYGAPGTHTLSGGTFALNL